MVLEQKKATRCSCSLVLAAGTRCWYSLLVRSHFGSSRLLSGLGFVDTRLGLSNPLKIQQHLFFCRSVPGCAFLSAIVRAGLPSHLAPRYVQR